MLTNGQITELEDQITEEKKTVDFDTREFTIEFLVQKYLNKIDVDENDIFGDDVNIAARLESISESYRRNLVTSGIGKAAYRGGA